MRPSKPLLALLIAAAIALPASAHADNRFSAGAHIGPPPQVVYAPAPPPGYAWAPGYWAWDGYRQVWVDGRWVPARHAYFPAPRHWEDRWDEAPRRDVEALRRNYREQRD